MRWYGLLCLVSSVLLWAGSSEAACTNNGGGVWTAASPTSTEIGLCMTAAATNDTINVPAGSANWGTGGLTISKAGLKLIGAGAGSTIISGAGPVIQADNVRFSGFTIVGTTSSSAAGIAVVAFVAAKGWRFDHNTVANASWAQPQGCLWAIADSAVGNVSTYGLIDHNTLTNCRVLSFGAWFGSSAGNYQWFQNGTQLGTNFNVFVEDNDYTIVAGSPGPSGTCNAGGTVLCNFTDANHGGSLVVRFNTIHNSYSEIHPSSDAADRGAKNFEFYHNTLSLAAAFQPNFSRPVFLQGSGSGMIFENHASANYQFGEIDYDYLGAEDGVRPAQCAAGGNSLDGNAHAGSGWPCWDQIGIGYDQAFMTYPNNPGQVRTPWYSWNNDQPNGTWAWTANSGGLATIYKNNRDFYQRVTPFTGATGMGVGTLAARPATCNADPTGDGAGWDPTHGGFKGVGYWATDQGEWNANQAGPDGQLYVCTATNTWTLYYTPYPYPHPLQGGSAPDTTPPAAPTNLRFAAQGAP